MKPILFNTEMVRANLDGRKTATRRVVKAFSATKGVRLYKTACGEFYAEVNGNPTDFQLHPPYLPGDVLYVRETWAEWSGGYVFKADPLPAYPHSFVDRWRPSIYMPKEAARIFLRVTDVRVERLQEITDEGAEHEGICGYYVGMGESAYSRYSNWNEAKNHLYDFPRGAFADLWTHTLKPTDIGKYGWAANPWVWVIEYERCEKPKEG